MPDDDALERLSKKLNAPKGVEEPFRSQVSTRVSSAPRGWTEPPASTPSRSRIRFTPLEVLFGASVVFFVGAVVIAFLLFFSGNNTVSTKNVDIAVSGPTEIGAGNTLELQIVITNRNAVPMELPDLIVEFPPGTRSDTDISVELPRIRMPLGTIESGQSVHETIRAVIFAVEGSEARVMASVEYRVPSSNAIFVAEATYSALVNQAPASITVSALKEIVSGQDASFTITVTSNATSPLKDMLLLAEYPPGFTFKSAIPSPASGSSAWSLGDIEPGGERSVVIRGQFTGEDKDTRVIHFTTGSKKVGQEAVIAAPLATVDFTVTVAKPFVGVTLALDGDTSPEHTVTRGQAVRGDIRWENNLPVRVHDLEIEVSLNGTILDRTKIVPERGFYQSNTNIIRWSRETDPRLGDIEAGASGVASFSFATLPTAQGSFKNPTLALTVTVRARRISETNVPETVQSTAVATVRIATDLVLNALLSRAGVFLNTGAVPPKAENETTYTITWSVANSANAVANAAVTGVLPSYTRFMNQISPANEAVSFNPVGGVVAWNIGDVAAGQSKAVSFQIGITPSLSQVGNAPTLIHEQRLSGFDRFIRANLNSAAPSLTTGSASANYQDGLVVP